MKRLLSLAVVLSTAAASDAATVTWGAAIDTGIIDSSAAALAVGNYVRIGYFGTLSDSQVIANAATTAGLDALNLDFHEFANTTIGTNTGGTAGTFSINSSPLYSALTGFVPASQIYFWVLNSTDTSTFANALSSATQTAIGYVPFANNAEWQFPASDASPAKSIDVKDFANGSSVLLAGSYVAGSTPALTPIFGAPNHALQLANVTVSPVPEPSTLAVGILTLIAAVGARRRNRN